MKKAIYIIDGARTPFIKARQQPGPFSAADLAVAAGRDLLLRQPFAPDEVGETIIGCVMPREDEANIGRIVSLRLRCGVKTPAWTVQRNCASGMQALDSAMKDMLLDRYDLVLAGGTEAMSHAPILWNPSLINWLGRIRTRASLEKKVKELSEFRLHFLKPVVALRGGLTDHLIGMDMGQTAEILGYQFHISRQKMDQFSLRSHQRLADAQDHGFLNEVVPLYDAEGHCFTSDTGLRRDTSLEKLASLKPFFDKPFGEVTAGNSSQVTDGAAMLILATEAAVKRYQLPILGRIRDIQWAALPPETMGLGPVMAATPLLQRNQLQLSDIDYWEINEAFAVQVLACLAAWENEAFCRQHLGLSSSFGSLDIDRLNIDGGAVALGHPVGASGARIVLHLLHILKRNGARLGVAAICIGGGQGGAMLLEV